MHRHSRQQVIEARSRVQAKWERYARLFVESPGHPIEAGDWWAQKERFNKLTLSCRDHAICRIYRAENRFSSGKRKFYRQRDVVDFLD